MPRFERSYPRALLKRFLWLLVQKARECFLLGMFTCDLNVLCITFTRQLLHALDKALRCLLGARFQGACLEQGFKMCLHESKLWSSMTKIELLLEAVPTPKVNQIVEKSMQARQTKNKNGHASSTN